MVCTQDVDGLLDRQGLQVGERGEGGGNRKPQRVSKFRGFKKFLKLSVNVRLRSLRVPVLHYRHVC